MTSAPLRRKLKEQALVYRIDAGKFPGVLYGRASQGTVGPLDVAACFRISRACRDRFNPQ
ncbi:protein of unknown function [Methylocaldum szegediense]|uniref:50S ribosomal protein L25 n=1 Tax=Methylocaldum szegediense TaxID=73780 RepID=A0ABM9I4T1_9GAMM|nr:protein of unknown function [Methylocaldum szegediense]